MRLTEEEFAELEDKRFKRIADKFPKPSHAENVIITAGYQQWEITLPFPSRDLMPNRKNGKHWSSSNSAKVKAKDAGFLASKELGLLIKPTILDITYILPDKRKRDLDNLLAASKAYIDGICLALGIDDNCFDCIIISRGYDKGNGRMVVELR